MAFNRVQFKSLIERCLKEIDLWSPEAVSLLMGTAAVESDFGTNLKQIGEGPARGAFQMEPRTFEWLRGKFTDAYPVIADFTFEQLEYDLRAAIIMARLKYRSIPAPLPAANDLSRLAAYWNKYYNCNLVYGTDMDFIRKYKKYC